MHTHTDTHNACTQINHTCHTSNGVHHRGTGASAEFRHHLRIIRGTSSWPRSLRSCTHITAAMTIEAGVLGISDMQIAPEKPPTTTTRTLASAPTSISDTNKNMEYDVVMYCALAQPGYIMTESHKITQHSTAKHCATQTGTAARNQKQGMETLRFPPSALCKTQHANLERSPSCLEQAAVLLCITSKNSALAPTIRQRNVHYK